MCRHCLDDFSLWLLERSRASFTFSPRGGKSAFQGASGRESSQYRRKAESPAHQKVQSVRPRPALVPLPPIRRALHSRPTVLNGEDGGSYFFMVMYLGQNIVSWEALGRSP